MRDQLWKKITSWILILTVALTSLSLDNLTVYAEETVQTKDTEYVEEESKLTADSSEMSAEEYDVDKSDAMLEENTETSTTFDVGDDKKMTVFYEEPVRYEDENGELTDYDPSLTKIQSDETMNNEDLSGYAFENTQGDNKHYFPEELSKEAPIIMEKDDYSIKLNPTEEVTEVTAKKEEYTNGYEESADTLLKAEYESEESKTTYSYTSSESGVKEEIILKERPEDNTFTYDLQLKGMTPRKNDADEGITLYDENSGEIVGVIAPPNMNDASMEAYSEKLTSKLVKDEKEEGLYHVAITADRKYLDAPERKYPVTIDPTASWVGRSDIGDTYVLSGSTYKNYNFYGNSIIVNAGKGSKGIFRTYMKFIDLTTKVKGYYVDSAVLKLYETGNSNSGQTVQAYRVKESWKCNEINWTNRPGYDTLYSSVKSTGKYKTARSLNLTSFVRGLAKGSIKNYGIMLRGADETGHYCEFVGSKHTAASLRPKLSVVYYDKPTAPSSVSVSPQYVKKGSKLTVNWAGISSKSLAYTQYRIAAYDPATKKDTRTSIAYSSNTKLKNVASGSLAIPASTSWNDGAWRIYVRGVDSGGLAGGEKGAVFYIDGTPLALYQPVIEPASSAASPASVTTPKIKWGGASDKNFLRVQCKVDNGKFVSMGTTASGTYTVPAGAIIGDGLHTITVQALDKAGNIKEHKLNYYYKEEWKGFGEYLPKSGTLSVRKDYGKTIISWENTKPLSDSVYYRIHRGETKDFKTSENTVCLPESDKRTLDGHESRNRKRLLLQA